MSLAPRSDACTTPASRSASAIAADPAVRAHASAMTIPTTSRIPKPRTIGTGESSSTRKPVAVASAAVAIVGALTDAARAIAGPAAVPDCVRRASSARDWNWIA